MKSSPFGPYCTSVSVPHTNSSSLLVLWPHFCPSSHKPSGSAMSQGAVPIPALLRWTVCFKAEFGTPGSLWLLLGLVRVTSSASVTRSQPSWPDQFLCLNSSPGVLPWKRRSSTFNDLFSLWACRVSLHPEGHKTTKATDKAIPKGSFHPDRNVHAGSLGCFKLCVKSGVVTSCGFFLSFGLFYVLLLLFLSWCSTLKLVVLLKQFKARAKSRFHLKAG